MRLRPFSCLSRAQFRSLSLPVFRKLVQLFFFVFKLNFLLGLRRSLRGPHNLSSRSLDGRGHLS